MSWFGLAYKKEVDEQNAAVRTTLDSGIKALTANLQSLDAKVATTQSQLASQFATKVDLEQRNATLDRKIADARTDATTMAARTKTEMDGKYAAFQSQFQSLDSSTQKTNLQLQALTKTSEERHGMYTKSFDSLDKRVGEIAKSWTQIPDKVMWCADGDVCKLPGKAGTFVAKKNMFGFGTSEPKYTVDVQGTVSAKEFVGPTVPIGGIIMWAAAAIPNDYMACDGRALSRTTYGTLFKVIGTNYGVGDGKATFNIPDLRGRTAIGNGNGTGLTQRTLGQVGGTETHTLTRFEMPRHNHSGTTAFGGNHGHTMELSRGELVQKPGSGDVLIHKAGNAPTKFQTQQDGRHVHGFETSYDGGGNPHNNMQPFAVVNYIIRAS